MEAAQIGGEGTGNKRGVFDLDLGYFLCGLVGVWVGGEDGL